MAHQYASLLSEYENKGKLGLPELADAREELDAKIEQLAEFINAARCCFVITGAGVSTSAGIADFRGPKGIWTLEKLRQQPATSVETGFEFARPTPTHMALVCLERRGLVKFLLSQNVDGLHSRFGFPLDRLAEIHGNVFMERCERCGRSSFRETPLQSCGRKPTGRSCDGGRRPCRGQMRDFLLDWESELPEPEWSAAYKYAADADLTLCLGTSLQISPVGELPLISKRRGGKFASINLQPTKHERRADLAIHADVDTVMQALARRLGFEAELKQECETNAKNVCIISNSRQTPHTFKTRKRKTL